MLYLRSLTMARRHRREVSPSSSWGEVTAMSGHASGKVCGVSDICFALTSRAFVHTQCDQYYPILRCRPKWPALAISTYGYVWVVYIFRLFFTISLLSPFICKESALSQRGKLPQDKALFIVSTDYARVKITKESSAGAGSR